MYRGTRSDVVALLLAFLIMAASTPSSGQNARKYFVIRVVDDQTGRGVPLVELETVNAICYVTDSNGIAAFYEPGLMGQTVFFHVRSHGYEFPPDGFNYRGKRIRLTEGGETTIKIHRINIAERLYRITGEGIYRDSLLANRPVPLKRPCINGLVLGQDSVLTAHYHGRLYWFWGDTNRPGYPLGNFHTPGAVSRLPTDGGLDPDVGVDLDYFVDASGFAKPTAKMPGNGPTWLDGLTVLRDASGSEHLLAHYVKIAKPMKVVAQGIVEFNDRTKEFEQRLDVDVNAPLIPHGHPVHYDVDGTDYVYFPMMTRVRARVADYLNPACYETYSCFQEGARADTIRIARDADGRIEYRWKTNTIPLTPDRQRELIALGQVVPREAWFQLTDIESGKAVRIHARSISWNAYRRRWIMIVCESLGSSVLGEIWYVEADSPIGPWVYGRKIVTHDRYSFYNPKQHPTFAKADGRLIYFEGTYTRTFSGNPHRTPRYDYNQIMYRLDLADPRLVLPLPVYQVTEKGNARFRFGTSDGPRMSSSDRAIAFYACDRSFPGAVGVHVDHPESGGSGYRMEEANDVENAARRLVFHGLPADVSPRPPSTVPLYVFLSDRDGRRFFSIRQSGALPGYRRQSKPLCLVWRDPRAEGL